MLSLILAPVVIVFGIKGFTRSGIPLSRKKNLTGAPAKLAAAGCILLGTLLLVDGLLSTVRIAALLNSISSEDKPVHAGQLFPTLHSIPAPPKPTARDATLDVPEDACDESLDKHELAGKWEIISAEDAGMNVPTMGYFEFKGNNFWVVEGPSRQVRTFEIDPNSEPKRLDWRLALPTLPPRIVVWRSIYRIDGDVLTLLDAPPFHPRPSQFVEKTTKENGCTLCKLRRVVDADK